MPVSTDLFKGCSGMSGFAIGLVVLNPESCDKKSNF